MASSLLGHDLPRSGRRAASEPGHGAAATYAKRAALGQIVPGRERLPDRAHEHLREVHQCASAEQAAVRSRRTGRNDGRDRRCAGDDRPLPDPRVRALHRLLEHVTRRAKSFRERSGRLQQSRLLHRRQEPRLVGISASRERRVAIHDSKLRALALERIGARRHDAYPRLLR